MNLYHAKLILPNHLPWLCIGDFNEITSQFEKAGGCLWPTHQMDRFHTAMHHCSFIDIGYVGSPFTWSRNHPVEGHIHIRLDQALANMTWKSLFPNATIHHVSMSSSDHSMLTIRVQPPRPRQP